jgi:O-antigen ligase
MRRASWILLVLFVFAIPWEHSLDAGAPFGNAARIFGMLTMLMAVPAVLIEGRFRRLSPIHWLTLACYLWFCCTFFWTAAPHETMLRIRAYAQEMILVWLLWEFVEKAEDLKVLLRAWLSGSWVLAILTIAGFAFSDGMSQEQVRFAAIGQDPNDVARLLVFGFPIALLLVNSSNRRLERTLCLMYFPAGFAAALLTASRSGLLLAMIALAGCAIAALRWRSRAMMAAAASVVFAAIGVFLVAPMGTLDRLHTLAEMKEYGDLNERVNIWSEGWRAFEAAPIAGHGAGSFVIAAKMAPEDTAHNTILSILVEGGICGLSMATAIVVFAFRAISKGPPRLRIGLYLLMVLWVSSSLTQSLWESRTTWLLIGIAAVCERIPEVLAAEVGRGHHSPVLNCERPGAAPSLV